MISLVLETDMGILVYSLVNVFIWPHDSSLDQNPIISRAQQHLIESRIISRVDAFDAMTSERPYKCKISIDKAKEELINNSGSQLAPNLVKIFVKNFKPDLTPFLLKSKIKNPNKIP